MGQLVAAVQRHSLTPSTSSVARMMPPLCTESKKEKLSIVIAKRVTACNPARGYRRLGGSKRVHPQGLSS
jgi:hypothetical protein